MQLALILAMLLLGGNQNLFNVIGQIKPVLEELGDENLQNTLSSVQQIGDIINAFQGSGLGDLFSFNGSQNGSATNSATNWSNGNDFNNQTQNNACAQNIGFPLKPVFKIADKNITYALSQYFAE